MIPKIILLTYLAILPLTFSVYTLNTFEQPKAWLTITVSTVLVLFANVYRRFNLVDVAVILGVLSAAVSTFTSNSVNTSIIGDKLSPMGLVEIASLAGIYFAVRDHFSGFYDRERVMKVLVLFAVPICVYALFQFFGWSVWQVVGELRDHRLLRPGSTLGHPNELSGLMVMLLPFAAYFAARERWAIPVVGLMVTIVVLCQSRGAWVAALATAAVMSGFSIKRRRQRAAGLLAGFACVLMPLCVVILGSSQFVQNTRVRISDMFSLGPARAFYWRSALLIFKRHPWFGVGTDSFRTAFEHVRTPAYWDVEPAGSIAAAHNDFLNTLATQGALGGAAFLFLVWAIVHQSRKAFDWAKGGSAREDQFTAACIASIAGYYVLNISFFPSVTTGAFFMTVLSFLSESDSTDMHPWFKKAWVTAVIAAATLLVYNLAALPMKASSCAAAAMSVRARDPVTALHMLDYAATLEPKSPVYPDLLGDVASDVGNYEMAARGYITAAQIEPEEAIYHFKYGNIFGNRDELELAELMEPANKIFQSVTAQ